MMKINNLIKSSAGIGMVQALLVASVVAGAGLVIMKTGQQQAKVSQTTTQRIIQSNFRDQVAEALQDGGACFNTLKTMGVLADQKSLPTIRHRDDAVIYAPQQKIEGMQEIKDMKLVGYRPAPGLRFHKTPLNILINTIPSREGAAAKSFGGQQKGHKIPLFLITRDNQVEMCTSDDSDAMLSALRDACLGFGGEFNEETATCEKIHGNDGIVLKRIQQKFCSTGNPACPHPYAGQVCSGVDVRGASHPNWVYGAFDGSGEKVCHCLPKNCANPALYCINTDLGTNWCDKVCPVGTKDEWTNWTPAPSTVCVGVNFTQTQTCSDPVGALNRTRNEVGTKTGGAGSCSYDSITLNPDGTETSVAQMVRVNEEYECSSVCSSSSQRNCSYVSDCTGAPGCSSWSGWEPADLSNTCNTSTVTQTRTCTSGSGAPETRTVPGSKSCNCSIWNDWLPSTDTVCIGESMTQTRKCAQAGLPDDTRVTMGTKLDGNCKKTSKQCIVNMPFSWPDSSNGSIICSTENGGLRGSTATLEHGESQTFSGVHDGYAFSLEGTGTGSIEVRCDDGVITMSGGSCSCDLKANHTH